ncbi:MAG: hypothetical protein AAB036_11190 [Elusimicrobiota bacterium]
MRNASRLLLALLVAGPGPAHAAALAPSAGTVRVLAPFAVSLGLAAGSHAPALKPAALTPSLAHPLSAAPGASFLRPSILTPSAVTPPAAAAIAPQTTLKGLPTELIQPLPESSNLETLRDFAGRAFDFTLGAESAATPPIVITPLGVDRAAPSVGKQRPLPESVQVKSSLPNLDSAVEMSVSHSYPGKIGSDPTQTAAQAIEEYIAFDGMPLDQKHMVIKYYEIGMPETGQTPLIAAIERLVEAGIKTTIITDFNPAAIGTFPDDERQNTDFEHITFKNSGPGRALEHLINDLGFKLKVGKSKFTVLSGMPLFNPRDKGQKPLMHDKGLFAAGPNGTAYRFAWNGTANMNDTKSKKPRGDLPDFGGRYNRVLLSKDAAANEVDWNHVLAEITAFDGRLSSKGLPKALDVPRRVAYPNGEFREIAFTNGRQNPNDRMTAMFERATKALMDAKARNTQPDFEIQEIIWSHFVLTLTSQVEAFRAYLNALEAFDPKDYRKRLKVFGVFDQQFISPSGWGEAAAFEGFLVQRPRGKSIFPFRSKHLEMMRLFGYLRLRSGVDQIDPDAAPTGIHLWHDKTTLMKVLEKDPVSGQMRPWTYAWTRSLNNSGHYQSQESQDMYRMLPDSRLAKEFEDSIKEVARAEPQYALPLSKAVAMVVLANMTQHTAYDNKMPDYVDRVINALSSQDYPTVETLLKEIIALPTINVSGVRFLSTRAGDLAERVERFVGFLSWHKEQMAQDPTLREISYRRALNIAVGLSANNFWGLRTALDIIYYNGDRSEDETLELLKAAWVDGLKMSEPFPESKKESVADGQSGESVEAFGWGW